MLNTLEKIQERVLVGFTLLGISILLIFGCLHLKYGKPELGFWELSISVLSIISLLIYRKTSNFCLISRVIFILMLMLFLTLIITGGFKGNGIFWIYTYPFLIFFLREKKAALNWNLLFVLCIVFLQILAYLGIIKLFYSYETILEALVAYLVISFLTYFYSDTLMSLLETLKEKAIHDPLTKAYNRGFVLTYLEKEMEKIKRGIEKGFCLSFIDLDDFKKINDTYGHLFGDRVLFEFAKIVRNNIRRSDVFGRIGGEEFAVVFPKTNVDGAHVVAERIRREIESHLFVHATKVTVSIGLAQMKKDDTPETLIARADSALYKAKRSGKNRVVIAD